VIKLDPRVVSWHRIPACPSSDRLLPARLYTLLDGAGGICQCAYPQSGTRMVSPAQSVQDGVIRLSTTRFSVPLTGLD
jgi:hypothetical protein